MVTLAVFVTGSAVALAFFHLVRGVIGFTPDFDRETLDRIGIPAAFLVFCCTGPVLLVRALEKARPGTIALSMRNTFAFTFLLLAWAGSLGIIALESARALL
ncbi:MAG: hypothetical protein Kow0026_17180 [Oricola sp.]